MWVSARAVNDQNGAEEITCLWLNSTLGLLLRIAKSNRPDPGRSSLKNTLLKTMPVLDYTKLIEEQLKDGITGRRSRWRRDGWFRLLLVGVFRLGRNAGGGGGLGSRQVLVGCGACACFVLAGLCVPVDVVVVVVGGGGDEVQVDEVALAD